ncbi:MAG: C-GCAxxG-C-C family protein [Anaerolineales bacterium]
MLAVGEYALGEVDERTQRMTTGFSGGVGDERHYLCGAFSAGVMIIGALYGRTQPDLDETMCYTKVRQYRDRFEGQLGSVTCSDLRAEMYGSGRLEPFSVLVERAVKILLEVLDEGSTR